MVSAWSIGTSQRGSYRANNAPAPGSYNPNRSGNFQPPSWRFGSASRSNLRANDAPGPGAYGSPNRVYQDAPKYSMRIKPGYNGPAADTPGPGNYNPKNSNLQSQPMYSLRPKTAVPSSTMSNPGPGQYSGDDYVKRGAPQIRFGSASRDSLRGDQNVPGPGTYLKNNVGRVNQPGEEGPQVKFGTASRDGLGDLAKAPGPGTYAFKSDFDAKREKMVGSSMVPRRPDSAGMGGASFPGPGAYQPATSFSRPKSPEVKIGTEPRGKLDNEAMKVPGPGTYKTPTRIIDEAPKISMGLRTSYSGYTNLNPGPGSYMPESHSGATMRKAPQYSLRPRTATALSTMANPGPGAYNPSVEQAKEQGPKVGFGSATRGNQAVGDAPGPGAYHRVDTGRPVSSGPKAPEFKFGTSSRDDFYASDAKRAPAPGQYNLRSTFEDGTNHGKGTTMVPRRPVSGAASNPGPGNYNPKLATKPSAPSYKIGSASRATEDREKTAAPGPGAYKFAGSINGIEPDRARPPSVKFGSDTRRPLSANINTPGAGSYNIQSQGNGPAYSMRVKTSDSKANLNPSPGVRFSFLKSDVILF
jgi:Sperm-tail PG-rich repeat